MTSLSALLTGGGEQMTEWVFGITQADGNKLDLNDAVGATKWPDPTTGAASGSEPETKTVNALGQTLTATDRNGDLLRAAAGQESRPLLDTWILMVHIYS